MLYLRWFFVFAWAGLIFFLSSQSALPIPAGIIGELLSKGSHFAEFLILAFLLYRALISHLKQKQSLIIAIVLSLLYAASDEFHQSFVSGRSAEISDFLADSAGIFTLGLIALLRKRL